MYGYHVWLSCMVIVYGYRGYGVYFPHEYISNREWSRCSWIILSDLGFLSGGVSDGLGAETGQAGCCNNINYDWVVWVWGGLRHMLICTLWNILRWNHPADTNMQQDVNWDTAKSDVTCALPAVAPELQKCIHIFKKSVSHALSVSLSLSLSLFSLSSFFFLSFFLLGHVLLIYKPQLNFF